ncbi:MAG TPA: hypothetical protein VGM16_05390 [Gammaproteobacteria bacterium]|jgi:hypothetical protein
MDEYSYLSVLIAIILGLAITQILQGFRGLLHFRDSVVFYWPSLVWAALILLIAVQSWWASFGLRHLTGWTFLGFAVVLLENICIYMVAALVLPDFAEERQVDLKRAYFKQVPWFYGLFIAALVCSLLKDLVLSGSLPYGMNLGFQLFFIAGSAALIVVRNETFHKSYTLISAVLFLAYIVALFGHLH